AAVGRESAGAAARIGEAAGDQSRAGRAGLDRGNDARRRPAARRGAGDVGDAGQAVAAAAGLAGGASALGRTSRGAETDARRDREAGRDVLPAGPKKFARPRTPATDARPLPGGDVPRPRADWAGLATDRR